MQNLEYGKIKEFQDELDNEIKNIKNKDNISGFVDGIIDIESYLKSRTKIMWVLKEPNSTEDELNWREEIYNLRTHIGIANGWAGTFNPIVYTSFGILHNKTWDNIPDTNADPSIIDILKSIAFVNVKKTPGGSVSFDNEIFEHHNQNKNILLNQIAMYNPDVIICGNTFDFLKVDLKISVNTFEAVYDEAVNMSIYRNHKFIIVDAYHPNARKNKKKYCNFIIENVNKWKK